MKWLTLLLASLSLMAFTQAGIPSIESFLNPYGLLSAVLFVGYRLDKKVTMLCYRVKAIELRMTKRKDRNAD